jgi:hypothetical protein
MRLDGDGVDQLLLSRGRVPRAPGGPNYPSPDDINLRMLAIKNVILKLFPMLGSRPLSLISLMSEWHRGAKHSNI